MIKDIDTIEVELQERVSSIARTLIETIHSKTDDPENFITINEVESLLETALANTKLEYLDKMRECLSNVDESSIIKLKKESMPKGGEAKNTHKETAPYINNIWKAVLQ